MARANYGLLSALNNKYLSKIKKEELTKTVFHRYNVSVKRLIKLSTNFTGSTPTGSDSSQELVFY